MVRRATCTAVSASISTPVGPTVSTVAVQATAFASRTISKSTATRVSASGWHSGIRSLVFLAAWMPAMRAMPSTSPFFAVPDSIRASVAGCISMRPAATAIRWVAVLPATSTMWAWPWASKWVRELMGGKTNPCRVDRRFTSIGHHTTMVIGKERLKASGLHLAISLCIASAAALLVFTVWYPYPYREVSGGRELFVILTSVYVVLGPLITLAIFNRRESVRELTLDLSLVAMIQLAALAYGLWTDAVARPVQQ